MAEGLKRAAVAAKKSAKPAGHEERATKSGKHEEHELKATVLGGKDGKQAKTSVSKPVVVQATKEQREQAKKNRELTTTPEKVVPAVRTEVRGRRSEVSSGPKSEPSIFSSLQGT